MEIFWVGEKSLQFWRRGPEKWQKFSSTKSALPGLLKKVSGKSGPVDEKKFGENGSEKNSAGRGEKNLEKSGKSFEKKSEKSFEKNWENFGAISRKLEFWKKSPTGEKILFLPQRFFAFLEFGLEFRAKTPLKMADLESKLHAEERKIAAAARASGVSRHRLLKNVRVDGEEHRSPLTAVGEISLDCSSVFLKKAAAELWLGTEIPRDVRVVPEFLVTVDWLQRTQHLQDFLLGFFEGESVEILQVRDGLPVGVKKLPFGFEKLEEALRDSGVDLRALAEKNLEENSVVAKIFGDAVGFWAGQITGWIAAENADFSRIFVVSPLWKVPHFLQTLAGAMNRQGSCWVTPLQLAAGEAQPGLDAGLPEEFEISLGLATDFLDFPRWG